MNDALNANAAAKINSEMYLNFILEPQLTVNKLLRAHYLMCLITTSFVNGNTEGEFLFFLFILPEHALLDAHANA